MTTALLPPPDGELRLVVFDWDGTLMDSPRRIVHCLQQTSVQFGLSPPPEPALRSIIGLGADLAVRRLFPQMNTANVHRFVQAYRSCYLQATDAPETPLYPGAKDLLHWLEEREILLAIATGKSRRGLDQALEYSGLKRFFIATATADEHPSKPDPAMLRSVMEQVGVEPCRTRMVGDSTYDLQMAHAAGVPALGVTHGAHPVESLQVEQPLVLVRNLPDLHELWRRESAEYPTH